MNRSFVWTLIVAAVLLGTSARAASKLKGWVTKVDREAQTIQVSGQTISTKGVPVTGGALEPGAFISVKKGQIKVKPQRLPADDEVVRFPVKAKDNPGRSEFSHLRHFNALGEKQCKTCHSPQMGLLTSPVYASRAVDPALEAHGPRSLGRYCATCHNGATRLAQVGALRGRKDQPIFTATKTGDTASCERCHAPSDHGADFTPAHGDIAEKSRGRRCFACHAGDWGPSDRQGLADFLAAEKALGANPDDPKAALVVGPNNFCVYCHRIDTEWR